VQYKIWLYAVAHEINIPLVPLIYAECGRTRYHPKFPMRDVPALNAVKSPYPYVMPV
jgi:hypothetical protein